VQKRRYGTNRGISYREWDQHNQTAEIGLEISNPANRGKGFGRDGMTVFLDFMFRQLNLNRIELLTAESNTVSHQLYFKLGFKLIGTIREKFYNPLEDSYTNILYMDLLRREWLEIRGRLLTSGV
jgi:RimJ/RimL family protein N-acetyltransferase